MDEEATFEEMREILSLMVIEINLAQIFQITIVFKERCQVEITTMLQN